MESPTQVLPEVPSLAARPATDSRDATRVAQLIGTELAARSLNQRSIDPRSVTHRPGSAATRSRISW